MADVGGGAPRGHDKKKKGKKKRRLNVRIDMTPMVDVAFLLLTFFMLTTTMNRPQTMEINLPPDNKTKVEIAASNLLTLLVKENGDIFYYIGLGAATDPPPARVAFSDLRKTLDQKNKDNPKLVTLIKIDRKGKYHMMVDIMDELNLANITRFSLAPMTPDDLKKLDKVSS
jgi:biopolymer transport protein ExbD